MGGVRTLVGSLCVVASLALLSGLVWAHPPTGVAGAVGWADEVAFVLGPVLIVLAVGWMTLDGRRRPQKLRKHRRGRDAR